MCVHPEVFHTFHLVQPPRPIHIGDHSVIYATAIGTVLMRSPIGHVFQLTNTLFVPGLGCNLVSLRRSDEAGNYAIIPQGQCRVSDPRTGLLLQAQLHDGLYFLERHGAVLPFCSPTITIQPHRQYPSLAHRAYNRQTPSQN